MIGLVTIAAFGYLLGSVPFSYLSGKLLKGIDLRDHGSGNLGATNTFRIMGAKVAIVVLVLDIAKGFVPVWAATWWPWANQTPLHWLALTAMFAAIFGHLYSVYLKFAGGKGIATSAGAFLALSPWAFLGAFSVFAVTFAVRRIVSLGSILASISLPLFVYLAGRYGLGSDHPSYLVVSAIIMLIVLHKHRSNISRLIAGTEPKLARKKT